MKYLKRSIDWVPAMVCSYIVFDGVRIFLGTTGRVQGSLFGMLITPVNQLRVVMVGLALFASLLATSDAVTEAVGAVV